MYSLSIGDTLETIALTSAGVMVTRFDLGGGDMQRTSAGGEGAWPSLPVYCNVTGSVELMVEGATQLAVQETIGQLERILDRIHESAMRRPDERVYLTARFDDDGQEWRSELLAARLELPNVADVLWRKQIPVVVTFTRRYYWEAGLMSIPVTSAATPSPSGSGALITNGSGNANYVTLAPVYFGGSLPMPVKLTLSNESGANATVRAVYVGNYALARTPSANPMVTGGSATLATTTETQVATWNLGAALLNAFDRRYAQPLIAFSNPPSFETLVRGWLQYSEAAWNHQILVGGEFVQSNAANVYEMSALALPPSGVGLDPGGLRYRLTAQAVTVPDTLTVSWVQFMPAGAGLYRRLRMGTSYVTFAPYDAIVDDGLNLETYMVDAALGYNLPGLRPSGEYIHIWPNRTNVLRVVVDGNTLETGVTWRVKVEHRMRRGTI